MFFRIWSFDCNSWFYSKGIEDYCNWIKYDEISNKITYTKYKRIPYHSYYESYSVGDYLVENDYKKIVKFKKLSNGKIEIDGYYTFSKSDEYQVSKNSLAILFCSLI